MTKQLMTLPTAGPGPQTMTSLEIAELTGKRHNDVMRDIRVMLTDLHGEGGSRRFASSYRSPQNKELPCFHLPKRECLILVSGYSVELRAAIIDRWEELEAQATKPALQLPDFTNPAEAARAWAGEYEQKVIAQQRVIELAPRAAVGDKVVAVERL